MIEVYGNLWTHPADLHVITTNGFVKKDGSNVMGRGCAQEASKRYPVLPKALGAKITEFGNNVYLFPTISLATYPVKRHHDICKPNKSNVVTHMQKQFEPGSIVPGWALKAEINVIQHSAYQLVQLMDNNPQYKIAVLPRVGAGAGELQWNDVKEYIEHILDDRFHVITYL